MSDICTNATLIALETCRTVLDYVLPTIGAISLLCIIISPLPKILKIKRSNEMGSFDITPYPFLTITSLSWMMFGILIKDYFILAPNIVGYIFGTYYILSSLPYCTTNLQTRSTYILLTGISIILFLAMLSFLLFSPATAQFIIGITNIIALLFQNSSPLFQIKYIIHSRNSSSIYIPLSIGVWFTSLFYLLYGIVKSNNFIVVPNAMCLVLASIQLLLTFVYPRREYTTAKIVPVTLNEVNEEHAIEKTVEVIEIDP